MTEVLVDQFAPAVPDRADNHQNGNALGNIAPQPPAAVPAPAPPDNRNVPADGALDGVDAQLAFVDPSAPAEADHVPVAAAAKPIGKHKKEDRRGLANDRPRREGHPPVRLVDSYTPALAAKPKNK